jgi:PPOX class probable F420-dependent enzyme
MMALPIPDTHMDLLENPVYVVFTTVFPSGQPHSTVVWWDSDGDYIRVNTARGRQKEKNLKRNTKVSIMAVDPQNPYHWMEVRGVVEEVTEQGGVDHIEKLSWKYNGKGFYGGYAPAERRQQETRVMVKIRPTKVMAYPFKR